MEDDFRHNAEHNAEVVIQNMRKLTGPNFGYDGQSVAALDDFIESMRLRMPPKMAEDMIFIYGSYLGECIRRQYGGEWEEIGERWGIRFEDGSAAFPFAKVAKQFANGSEDSIQSFFTMIPYMRNMDTPAHGAAPGMEQ